MLVVIEGGDGSGKTTLINELAALGYNTIKIPRDISTNEVWLSLAKGDLVFADRSFISDVVYRMFDRGKILTTIEGQLEVIKHGMAIILCHTDTSFEDGMKRGEDNITDVSAARFIKDIYKHVVRFYEVTLNVPVLLYDWHSMTVKSVINFLDNLWLKTRSYNFEEGGKVNDTRTI